MAGLHELNSCYQYQQEYSTTTRHLAAANTISVRILALEEINVSLSAAKTRDSTRKITRSRERARRHTRT